MIIAVLTGDVINSRKTGPPQLWLNVLKDALSTDDSLWEVYRGDSFQLSTAPEKALLKAIYIKACLKTIKNADVRIAIGLGKQEFVSRNLSESNGQAFVFSGEKFETLKKDRVNLAIKTPWSDLDFELNIVFRLALIAMDNWSPAAAEIVKIAIENPDLSQKDLAGKSSRSQSSVSEALKRASFDEMMGLDSLYRKKLQSLILT